jgi:hypothetical protein
MEIANYSQKSHALYKQSITFSVINRMFVSRKENNYYVSALEKEDNREIILVTIFKDKIYVTRSFL